LCHRADGRFDSFAAESPPLGIVTGTVFESVEIDLRDGSLYSFSDGLTEACTENGEQLGPEGLQSLIEKFAHKPVDERVEAIIADVGELELRDDLTLLALCDDGPPS
jgi:serine phosphatase RsbU (regulator of sigma subunit)